jgi:1-acyl-sn-glycerol-3-phosphate acyltransferase
MCPEGRIHRSDGPIQVRGGLMRLAQLAQSQGVQVPVIPVGLGYSQAPPRPLSRAAVCFGEALHVPNETGRDAAQQFNDQLTAAMHTAEQAARKAVGRPLKAF